MLSDSRTHKNSFRAQDMGMKTPEKIAWELFEKTGKPGYYMLYRKLKGEDDTKG